MQAKRMAGIHKRFYGSANSEPLIVKPMLRQRAALHNIECLHTRLHAYLSNIKTMQGVFKLADLTFPCIFRNTMTLLDHCRRMFMITFGNLHIVVGQTAP